MDVQSDKLTIETPELIPLEFPLAGVGSRFLAIALDSLIQLAAGVAVVIVGLLLVVPGHSSHRKNVWVASVGIIFFFLLQFGYFTFFESLWNGQTPGKRRFRLRVIKESGRPISVYDAVIRNLMRTVDSLPGFYGVGILSALMSSTNKRLGDYVAGTVVVHEEPLASKVQGEWASQPVAVSTGYDVAQLTPEDFQLIDAFLTRREQLEPLVRKRMAGEVARRLSARLGIPTEGRQDAEPLLERLAQEYRSRMQYR
jgi:uncharacterized RDD family membrane protein YckC